MSESTSGLRDHAGYWLRRLSDEVHLGFERRLATRGVTVAQWNVLVSLYRGEGETVGELAKFIEVDAAAISRVVDRLEEKGLVVRAPYPDSRRRVLIMLTPEAEALVPELIAMADTNDEAFFGPLLETEREALVRQLRFLLDTHRQSNSDHSRSQEGSEP